MKTKFSTRMLALALILTLLVPMLVFQASAEDGSATITFDDKAKRTTFTSSQQVWEENGITVTNDKAASTNDVADYFNPARFYKGSKLTVAFDKPITKIVFDCNSSSHATALKSAIGGTTVSVSSDKVTVNLDSPVTSYTVSSLTGGQVRLDSVTVYYATSEGGEPTPSIAISGDGALQSGDTLTLTATPANITSNVAWSSSDETVATVDGGVVTGKKMGKATITASIGEVQATHEVTVYPKENSEITVGEALEIATLAGESGVSYTYMIMGTVKSIDTEYSTDYKNITVTISDDTGSISVFRMKGGENLAVGQTIIVCGKLQTYEGAPQVSQYSEYELVLNESEEAIVEALNKLDVKMSLAYRYETSVETVTKPAVTSDTLNFAFTGIPAENSYKDWSGKTGASGAVYAGQSAGSHSSIQLRSDKSSAGIVSTTSGGKIKSITVTWNSNTADARTLDIYGKNEAYTSATELYNTDTQGTKIASLTRSNGATQTVIITGDYSYIGIRSKSSAQYIDSIVIEWASASGEAESVEKVYKNSSFALRFGAEKALADIEGITSYGLVVSAGDKEVYFSTDANSWMVDDAFCSVTVDLGDIINDLTKLSTKFTAKAYVEVDGVKYVSKVEATYSVADMIKEYHGLDISEVTDLYDYLAANGLI